MNIGNLTHTQCLKIYSVYPDWLIQSRPDWIMLNHPEIQIQNSAIPTGLKNTKIPDAVLKLLKGI